jgi:endonuclease/exonuclease/phosphatase family metal-dependent hydrolase
VLTVGTLNVWGRWAEWPARLRALRESWPVPGPDVLLLQEVRQDGLGDQAAEIADALGYPHRASVEGHRAAEDASEGLAILARRPLGATHDEVLPASDPCRRVLVATVDGITVVCGHTVAVPEDVRRAQVEALVARGGEPLILGADLNDTPEHVAPLLERSGLRDALDGDAAPTWPMSDVTFREAWELEIGRAPTFSLERRRLDYLLSRGLRVLDAGVAELEALDGRHASDHALVWATYAR